MKCHTAIISAAAMGLCLLCLSGPALGEVYKWVDEDGVVNYSAQPPGNQDATAVDTPDQPRKTTTDATAGAAADPAGGRKATAEDIADATRPDPAPAAEPGNQDTDSSQLTEEEQVAECQRSRQIIAEVEPRTRVVVTDSEGNSQRLSDTERLALLEEKRAYIAENC